MKKSSTMTYAITGDPAFCTLRRMFSLFFRMRVVYYIRNPNVSRRRSSSKEKPSRNRASALLQLG